MPLEFETGSLGFSLPNALFLARACEIAYIRDSAKQRAAAADLGMQATLTPFDAVDPEDNHDYHGFVASNDEMAVLAFRGVDNLSPWLTDTAIAQKPAYGGLVHKGLAEGLEFAWKRLEPILKEQMDEHDLWITGHGLGGALAILAAAKLQQHSEVEAVYTFGAPRVGNRAFYDNYQPIAYRLVNNNDVVAHVPPEVVPVGGYHYYSYKHVGTLVYFDRHGLLNEGTSDWSVKKQLMREQLVNLGQPPSQWFQDHPLSSYVDVVKRNM